MSKKYVVTSVFNDALEFSFSAPLKALNFIKPHYNSVGADGVGAGDGFAVQRMQGNRPDLRQRIHSFLMGDGGGDIWATPKTIVVDVKMVDVKKFLTQVDGELCEFDQDAFIRELRKHPLDSFAAASLLNGGGRQGEENQALVQNPELLEVSQKWQILIVNDRHDAHHFYQLLNSPQYNKMMSGNEASYMVAKDIADTGVANSSAELGMYVGTKINKFLETVGLAVYEVGDKRGKKTDLTCGTWPNYFGGSMKRRLYDRVAKANTTVLEKLGYELTKEDGDRLVNDIVGVYKQLVRDLKKHDWNVLVTEQNGYRPSHGPVQRLVAKAFGVGLTRCAEHGVPRDVAFRLIHDNLLPILKDKKFAPNLIAKKFNKVTGEWDTYDGMQSRVGDASITYIINTVFMRRLQMDIKAATPTKRQLALRAKLHANQPAA